MPIPSPYPPLNPAATNVLDYVFPAAAAAAVDSSSPPPDDDDVPLWIDSQDPSHSLSPRQALQWIKRTASGLTGLGLRRGDVVMVYSLNNIFVPPAYYGIVGGGFVFSGVNPAYTVPGQFSV